MSDEPLKLVVTSYERWNGGAAAKRKYGSSTITRFCCHEPQDARAPSRWVFVDVGGGSSSDRKKLAAEKAAQLIRALPPR
jgi:hypothetical protein